MDLLILSCSLSPKSRSAVLASELESAARAQGDSVELIDLREVVLPFCDAATCYGDKNLGSIVEAMGRASAVCIATPIYNYEVGGATRNLVALTGKAWTEKVVGFICAAGGEGSYMAVMSLANSLMLDFRCIIVPRFVYATGRAFDENGRLVEEKVIERIGGLASDLHRLGEALA